MAEIKIHERERLSLVSRRFGGRLIYGQDDEFPACHRRSVRRIVNDDFQAQGSFVREGNYLRGCGKHNLGVAQICKEER